MATLSGVWVFNKTIDLSILSTTRTYSGPFALSDGTKIYHFQKTSNYGGGFCLSYMIQNEFTAVYSEKSYGADASVGWISPLYMTIDFGETPIEVSDTVDTFIRTNAVQHTSEDEELPNAIITYLDKRTELPDGKTATMSCTGKRAATDIVVAFQSAGTITCNGTETAVEAGKTATLTCAGKRMLTDVVVSCEAIEEEPKTYSLTIVTEGDIELSGNPVPATIAEGETVTFDLSGEAPDLPEVIHNNAANVTYTAKNAFVGSFWYIITIANPIDDVVITLTGSIAPDLGL